MKEADALDLAQAMLPDYFPTQFFEVGQLEALAKTLEHYQRDDAIRGIKMLAEGSEKVTKPKLNEAIRAEIDIRMEAERMERAKNSLTAPRATETPQDELRTRFAIISEIRNRGDHLREMAFNVMRAKRRRRPSDEIAKLQDRLDRARAKAAKLNEPLFTTDGFNAETARRMAAQKDGES